MVTNRIIISIKILTIIITSFLIVWLIVKNVPGNNTFIKDNVKNCEKVKHNDTLEEVLQIMGKPDQIYNHERKVKGKRMRVANYHYSAPLAASVGVDIYFDPINNKVIDLECKD